ncbi:MAG TPA: hypothetical protein VMS64_21950 [Candidatus Methylomirabilis sp.]|nr:hypothetical protein [Candidatus Methylomirabilis sp.]
MSARALRQQRPRRSQNKFWVHTVTTVSTSPPEGLFFPGLFRGALDVRARTITDEMAAVARELAGLARSRGIRDDDILPRMDEWDAFPRVVMVAGLKAQEQGVDARSARGGARVGLSTRGTPPD